MRSVYTEPVTGWTFEADSAGQPPASGGISLSDIMHQGHSFARDVRLIGLWLKVETVTPSGSVSSTADRFITLDSTFFTLGNVTLHAPTPTTRPAAAGGGTFRYLAQTADALSMSHYFQRGGHHIGWALTCTYAGRSAILSGLSNCEVNNLDIEQIFLFSGYSNSPPHEPSGALMAARFHPMLKFRFTPSAAVDRTRDYQRIDSIRADYRLHIKLDRHHTAATSASLPWLGNRSGFFRDRDTLGSAVLGGITGLGVSAASFAAIEKPLVLEGMGPGLAMGFNVYLDPVTHDPQMCWDNVHQWSVRTDPAEMISAPGAFHAAHIHWRWGAIIPDSSAQFKPASRPASVERYLAARGSAHESPLVDPRIWIQSIRIAVTEAHASLDPARRTASQLSFADWKSLFTGYRAIPNNIYAGADIVTWLSFEVHRTVTLPSFYSTPTGVTSSSTYHSQAEGVIFYNGIFFAHDAEMPSSFPPTGPTTADHRPRSVADLVRTTPWFRPAS
jgi:hypothetical protein